MTIINLTESENIRMMQYESTSALPETCSLQELPPIFAHIVSTGNALVNMHDQSKYIEDLRRSKLTKEYRSHYFTALPIYAGKEVIGAIALTDYPHEQLESSLNLSTFIFCLDILRSLIVEQLLTTPKTESLQKITAFNDLMSKQKKLSFNSIEEIISFYGNALATTFGWRVLSASLPTADHLLKVISIQNFDDEVKKQVLNGKLYAHEDNKQGPLALAVHEKKPVILTNTRWLQGVVHTNTTKFFAKHATKTAAFIPVLTAQDQKPCGVYWIEGVKNTEISYADRELFMNLIKTISEQIKLFNSTYELKQSRQSLAQFLPEDLVDDYLAGKDITENDHGFLLMIDLKGSTRLAHKIGNANFHKEISELKNIFKNSLEAEQWVFQQHTWDSFEFTMTAAEDSEEKIDTQDLLLNIEANFEKWKNGLMSNYESCDEVSLVSFRTCLTFGDTSRGIVEEGKTITWRFVGNAIAIVSKVEQESKKLPGKVFCDHSMLNRTYDKWTKLIVTNQGIIVYGLKEEIKKAA